MNSILYRIQLPFGVQPLGHILIILFLISCGSSQLNENSPGETLHVPAFRLLADPQEVVQWHYQYTNRAFALPSYRTTQGNPLPGWDYRLVTTRRFFTDQSARVYFRIVDLHQSRVFSSPRPAATEAMRIWPVGSILVLETFLGKAASAENATPTAIDCLRKFKPDQTNFPVDTLFAGEWCYQRFSAEGKVRPMPAGASACHQCHGTALRLTGDSVFTVISKY